MINTFNDEPFELDKNLLGLGLQVFCPIVVQNYVLNKLASPMPLPPGVVTNTQHNFLGLLSNKPLFFQLLSFKPLFLEKMAI
jgi:hypothetical protein